MSVAISQSSVPTINPIQKAHLAHQAVFRLAEMKRLNIMAFRVLGMFLHKMTNKDGWLNLRETRWDSRASWCLYLGKPISEISKKQITNGFHELHAKGLMLWYQTDDGRTFRRLTDQAIDLIISLMEMPRQPEHVSDLQEQKTWTPPDLHVPSERKPIQAQNNIPSSVPEPELNEGIESESFKKSPPNSGGRVLSIVSDLSKKESPKPKPKRDGKAFTLKSLAGDLINYLDEYASIHTAEAYVKAMLRDDFTGQEIDRAMEIRKRELMEKYGYHAPYKKNHPGVKDDLKRLCGLARKELEQTDIEQHGGVGV